MPPSRAVSFCAAAQHTSPSIIPHRTQETGAGWDVGVVRGPRATAARWTSFPRAAYPTAMGCPRRSSPRPTPWSTRRTWRGNPTTPGSRPCSSASSPRLSGGKRGRGIGRHARLTLTVRRGHGGTAPSRPLPGTAQCRRSPGGRANCAAPGADVARFFSVPVYSVPDSVPDSVPGASVVVPSPGVRSCSAVQWAISSRVVRSCPLLWVSRCWYASGGGVTGTAFPNSIRRWFRPYARRGYGLLRCRANGCRSQERGTYRPASAANSAWLW
jgi:hypothetical protein